MRRCIAAGFFFASLGFGQDATLSGRITDVATHQPVAGAQISLRGGRGGNPSSATSDANGAYSIRLPAGQRAGLEISKAGYSTLDLRSTDSTQIRLNAGDSDTHDFELSKPGSLSGHLVDRDSGKPLEGFLIHAIHWYKGTENTTGYRYGPRTTSADGSFSFSDLPPAGYVIVVDPPARKKITVPDAKENAEKKIDEAGYGPAWYPDVPQPAMATPVLIGYGENRKIEIALKKHELLHIAGTLQVPEGLEGSQISLTLATEEKGRPTGAESVIPHAGPFLIDGLEPGSYRILAATGSKDRQIIAFANRAITLTGHSVDDLKMELRPGVSLRVELKMSEEKADPPKRFNFTPLSTEGWGPMDDAEPPGAQGKMNKTGLPAGKYQIALMRTPGYAVASTALNGAPVPPGAEVDLQGPESVLTVVLTTQLGSLTGLVRDSDQHPVADAEVVLVRESVDEPADMIEPDRSGRFAFTGLAPGRYQVIAVSDVDRRWALDSAFIRDRMRTAEVVVVSAGQSTSVDVQVGK